MAQASSAQREPSMEEILASIRRIIEDNDTGRRPAVDFEQMRPEPEDDRGDRNIIEVEAFRAEFQAPKPVEAKPVEVTPTAAKLETARRDEVASARWPSAEPKSVASVPSRTPVDETPAPAAVVEAPATQRASAASWAPQSTVAVEQMERLAGPAREAEKVEPQIAAVPVDPVVVEETLAPKAAIISEQAGRQVSAAFGELNDAYAARSRKSFDDIATEMMRPMLQDWLDNNLPTLVERLVREEIERVARGS